MPNYTIKKECMKKKKIKFMNILFDNGDLISISKKEIVEFNITLYDKLIVSDGLICPIAAKGRIVLNIQKTASHIYNLYFVEDSSEYENNRKKYIENMICNENGITRIFTFDENNWSKSFFLKAKTMIDGDNIVIDIIPNSIDEPFESDFHTIKMAEVKMEDIRNITLDLENCEYFDVYEEEIVDLQIKTKETLIYGSSDYKREIEDGYIKIKLNKSIDYRKGTIFSDDQPDDQFTYEQIMKRIFENKKENEFNVCRLIINYDYPGFGLWRTEEIEIEDLNEKDYEEDCEEYCYIGGYVTLLDDSIILLEFGESAKKHLK